MKKENPTISRATAVVRILLILSAALMVAGHYAVMSSGDLFDKVAGQPYDLHSRWVSDFAAKWPEGTWIKVAIIVMCVAVIVCYRAKIKRLPSGSACGFESWVYHIVPFLIVVGLIMVIAYDVSRPRYVWVESGFWPFRYGAPKPVPMNERDWTIFWYHSMGFRLFVVGFFVAVLSGLSFRRSRANIIPIDWLIVFLSIGSMLWLFSSVKSLPGIPQRFLLAASFLWFWREAGLEFQARHSGENNANNRKIGSQQDRIE